VHRVVDSSTSSSEPGWGRLALGLGLPCLVALGAIVGALWCQREALRLPVNVRPAIERLVIPRIEAAQRLADYVPRMALFGDSFATCDREPVAQFLQQEIHARGPANYVMDVSYPAFRPLQFYYLLDEVIAARPQGVVVEVNLPYLSSNWRHWRALRYLSLSRKLAVGRALRVRAALSLDGLSPFDPLVYRLEDATDTLFVADGIHDWGVTQLDDYGHLLNDALGLPTVPTKQRNLRRLHPFNARQARSVFEPDQTRHPMAGVLRRIGRELRQAGVEVLYYVSPVPVGRLDDLGVREELDLPARIERLRVAVGAAPEEWVDLHALVSTKAVFKDWVGHMHPEGCRAVAHALGEALAARDMPGRPDGKPKSTYVRR
jgi:hypothetical protein